MIDIDDITEDDFLIGVGRDPINSTELHEFKLMFKRIYERRRDEILLAAGDMFSWNVLEGERRGKNE